MIRSSGNKARNKKRLYAVTLFIVLSAAAGIGLYRLPPSLLDVGGIFRLAADKFSSLSADNTSAEAVLRGTIFDRNLAELAVSYNLYTLYVRPSEVSSKQEIVSALSSHTGLEESELEIRLHTEGSLIKIADNLESRQADAINKLGLSGVLCTPTEERFYPEHEVAADLIGYVGEGIGLAGVEGTCDTILQHSDFKAATIPEIDFKDSQVLGDAKLDIILTLDIELQKAVENRLRDYLRTHGASRGLAIVMNARTGAVLAWASRPSFNPNYFWQNPGSRNNTLASDVIDPDLYRDMIVQAAAVRKMGGLDGKLLPVTLAAENYGLQEDEISRFEEMIGFGEDALCRLPVCGENLVQGEEEMRAEGRQGISALQFLTTAAGLLNGGWKIEPYILESIYDEGKEGRYQRSKDYDAAGRRRIMTPSMGIAVRLNLSHELQAEKKDIFLRSGSVTKTIQEGDLNRYIMQNMLIGAIPARAPELIMLMVTRQDNLNPLPLQTKNSSEELIGIGEDILPEAYKIAALDTKSLFPGGHDASNYNQFLISRRIDYREQKMVADKMEPVMPEVKGMSLRKGLQRLNAFNLKVRVEGSGRIVTQQPEPGKPLKGVGECTLTLESSI